MIYNPSYSLKCSAVENTCSVFTALWRGACFVFVMAFFTNWYVCGEPIVISGNMVPQLIGTRVSHIRVVNGRGVSIPFQVDECTETGEYYCDQGKYPNIDSANGILDEYDEIVFLKSDCDKCSGHLSESLKRLKDGSHPFHTITVDLKGSCRQIHCIADSTLPLSDTEYIAYDHAEEYLQTRRYYAQFGKERFYFRRAGIIDPDTKKWIHLTRELRVELMLKALWGLLPIHYNEESMVCYVRRYKVGPVRLIRRGDFHLNVGLGVRGSKAAVNQICYPELVQVPVKVHVPFRLGKLFREAWIEMTPVIDSAGIPYTFSVPHCAYSKTAGDTVVSDTLIPCNPDNNFFSIVNKRLGIGWVLTTTIDSSLTKKSGYISRIPSTRNGVAEYGYRLQLRDLPGGYYVINNWVMFTEQSQLQLKQTFKAITDPAVIASENNREVNLLKGRTIKKDSKKQK